MMKKKIRKHTSKISGTLKLFFNFKNNMVCSESRYFSQCIVNYSIPEIKIFSSYWNSEIGEEGLWSWNVQF